MQQYAVWYILLQSHSTCFVCPQHPSSGVLKTVTTASDTGQILVELHASNVLTWPRRREVPEDGVTVFSTPDDGYGGNPKHV